MRKTILTAGITLMLAAVAMAKDYAFPSPWNSAGKPSSELTQLIAITWDDNQYSGWTGSGYEPAKGQTSYSQFGYVDGKNPDTSAAQWNDGSRPNPLSIVTSKSSNGKNIGINWAVKNLDVPMTFNMITGVFINVYTDNTENNWNQNSVQYMGWQNGETDMGYTTGDEAGTPLGPLYRTGKCSKGNDTVGTIGIETCPDTYTFVHDGGYDGTGYRRIPTAWGREYRSEVKSGVAQLNTIGLAIAEAISKGHEIGNHTIDHMETNSVLPGGSSAFANQGFGKWGNEGFDDQILDPTPWGIDYDEEVEYGASGADLTRGWKINIGRYMTKNAWKGYIDLSADWLSKGTPNAGDKNGGLNYGKSKIFGFRAPRLETNSNMYFALSELGYKYDCGLEEGYEKHVDGRNFLWPYTTDNGVRNSWTQTDIGERVFIDTMPTGLWQIPVNCVIVPQNYRERVVEHWNDINNGLDPKIKGAPMSAAGWDGKITGFDFNLWILFGMTKEYFLETMKNTLNLRLQGNKAPFQYGAHTDYYTPIYDFGTLVGKPINEGNYSLNIDRGWNTYIDRQQGTEEWVSWAKTQNGGKVKFVTGKELVDTLAKWTDQGEAIIQGQQSLTGLTFEGETVDGDALGQNLIFGQDITLNAREGISNQPVFNHIFTDSEKAQWRGNITHLSLDYKSRTATAVRLLIDANENGEWDGVYDGDHVREVILAHRYSPVGVDGNPSNSYNGGTMRNSGKIPLTSFDFEQYYEGVRNYSSIDQNKILGIQIVPLAPYANTPGHGQVLDDAWWDGGLVRTADYELKFKIDNLTLHTGTPFTWNENDLPSATFAKVNVNGRALSLAGVTNNALKLNVAQSGKYDVSVFSANGRLLQSFRAQTLSAGVNTLKLNNLAKGVYMIKIQGIDTKQQLTKSALVM